MGARNPFPGALFFFDPAGKAAQMQECNRKSAPEIVMCVTQVLLTHSVRTVIPLSSQAHANKWFAAMATQVAIVNNVVIAQNCAQ